MVSQTIRRAVLLGALAAILCQPAWGRESREPRPTQPLGDVSAWVMESDFPVPPGKFARPAGFRLMVDATGFVTDCTITRSSGYEDVDRIVCEKLQERGRFIPATDPDGNAVPCPWSSSIRFGWPASGKP